MILMRTLAAAALLIVAVTGCTTTDIRGIRIDHVILGAPSVEQGMAEFERLTGVKPVYGGQHPGRGTENALVSLGTSYLEIVAPRAGMTPQGDLAGLAQLKKLTPIAWAVHIEDLDKAQRELRRVGYPPTPPMPGSRITPAGDTLSWTTFGFEKPPVEMAPFFIRWGDGVRHPSSSSPLGCGLQNMWLGDPDEAALHRLVMQLRLPIRTLRTEKPAMRLQIVCREGAVVFNSE